MQDLSHVNGQTEFDRIWALFRETRDQLKETSIQLRETDRILSERFKETDARFKETDAKFKETDAKFKETGATIKETAEQIKETDKVLSEKFKQTQRLIGNLTNSWGEFVEGIVRPSVIKMFNEKNININRLAIRETSHKEDETMEIDIIGHNGDYVLAIEVKTKLLSYDVIDFTQRLKKFRYFFPEYADRKLVGAVGGIIVDNSVRKLAEKKELFIIMQKGEIVEIINRPGFKPKIW